MSTENLPIDTLPVGDADVQYYGSMIPERVLQELIKAGLKKVKENPDLIDDLFHKLDAAAISSIKQYFLSREIPVRLNTPAEDFVLPLIAIITTSDTEDPGTDLIGDYLVMEEPGANNAITEIRGHAVKSEFQILMLTGKDSNAVLWLYYIVKAIITLNVNLLNQQGLMNIVLSGRDISLRQDVFPEFTYARALVLSCSSFFSVRMTERVAKSLTLDLYAELPGCAKVLVTAEV